MICSGNTCCARYFQAEINDANYVDDEDFAQNVQHEKCKVIQLVRRQMRKLQVTQHELASVITSAQKNFRLNLQDISHENENFQPNNEIDETPRFPGVILNSDTTQRTWFSRILRITRQRICIIVGTCVIALMILASLIYGTFLGASLCDRGKPCMARFKYTQVPRSLF